MIRCAPPPTNSPIGGEYKLPLRGNIRALICGHSPCRHFKRWGKWKRQKRSKSVNPLYAQTVFLVKGPPATRTNTGLPQYCITPAGTGLPGLPFHQPGEPENNHLMDFADTTTLLTLAVVWFQSNILNFY